MRQLSPRSATVLQNEISRRASLHASNELDSEGEEALRVLEGVLQNCTELEFSREEQPPPDEVIGDDTTEWHEDYSDASWAAESLGIMDSSDSDQDLSTLWDVPSFDHDTESEVDPDAENGWDSAPPRRIIEFPPKANMPPQILNMFKRPETECGGKWHAHLDRAIAHTPRVRVPLTESFEPGSALAEDLTRHSPTFRPWGHAAVLNRSPISTLDTIQESNSRCGSPILTLSHRPRPRSRSHSNCRASTHTNVKRKARSRSGSATGRLEASGPYCAMHTAGPWANQLDEDTRRVLARFQGFRALRLDEQLSQQHQRIQPVDQFVFSWQPQSAESSLKGSSFPEQNVQVDESLLSSKDRARYRRQLRRLRLRSARLMDLTSDSEDISDNEDNKNVFSSLQNTRINEPLMSSD